jgi:hypothetical protein
MHSHNTLALHGFVVEVYGVGGLQSCSTYMMTIIRHPIQYGVVHSTSSYIILYVVTNINHITHTQNENLPYMRIYIYMRDSERLCCACFMYSCTCARVCVHVCVCVRAHRVQTLTYLTLSPRSLSLYRVDTLAYVTLSCSS